MGGIILSTLIFFKMIYIMKHQIITFHANNCAMVIMVVKDLQGVEVGVVTSGTFSPSLKVGIALALINPGKNEGDELVIDVRGRTSSATIVSLPFSPSHVRYSLNS